MKPLGTHWLVDLFGCPFEALNDRQLIESVLLESIVLARLNLLHLISHSYEPQGVTAIALVSESHVSIHTWPEHGHAAVDIFTCGSDSELEAVCGLLVKQLKAKRQARLVVERGNLITQQLGPGARSNRFQNSVSSENEAQT